MGENGSKAKTMIIMASLGLVILGILVLIVIAEVRKNATVDYTTKRYNTEENREAFLGSPLGETAQMLAESWDNRNGELKDGSGFAEADNTTMMTPFLAVKRDTSGSWTVIGGSGKSFTTEGVKTLAVCFSYTIGASYRSETNKNGPTTGGSSEGARILLVDLETNTYQLIEITPKSLPKKTQSTPHYTLSDGTLAKTVAHALVLPFKLSENGAITGGKLSGSEYDGYRFPSSVKAINKLKIKGVSALTLPESITAIAAGVIPETVTLTVVPGSYGETFARENGCLYRKQGEAEKAYRYLEGCECGIEDLPNNAKVFPLRADGEWQEKYWYCTYNTELKDGSRHKANKIVTEPGTKAEAYALEHGCRYRYQSDPEDAYRIRREGLDWYCTRDYVAVPDGASVDSELTKWLNKQDALIVPTGSVTEKTLSDAGLAVWTGVPQRAARTVDAEQGPMTVIFDFVGEKLIEIALPENYSQPRFSNEKPQFVYNELIKEIKKDFGLSLNTGIVYADDYALLRVHEGSKAEAALASTNDMVYIIEESRTLIVTRLYSRSIESLPVTDELLSSVSLVRLPRDCTALIARAEALGIPYEFAE